MRAVPDSFPLTASVGDIPGGLLEDGISQVICVGDSDRSLTELFTRFPARPGTREMEMASTVL
jgi:hypothetical protein